MEAFRYYTAEGSSVISGACYGRPEVEEHCASPAIAEARAEWLETASRLASDISDDHKDLYGVRLRLDWRNMSLAALRQIHEGIVNALTGELERERENAARRVRECNARALRARKFDRSFGSLANAL